MAHETFGAIRLGVHCLDERSDFEQNRQLGAASRPTHVRLPGVEAKVAVMWDADAQLHA